MVCVKYSAIDVDKSANAGTRGLRPSQVTSLPYASFQDPKLHHRCCRWLRWTNGFLFTQCFVASAYQSPLYNR